MRMGEDTEPVSEIHRKFNRLENYDKAVGGSEIVKRLNFNKQYMDASREHARARDIVHYNNTAQVMNCNIKISKSKANRKK